MNTSKTLIGLLFFSIAGLSGCHQQGDSDSQVIESRPPEDLTSPPSVESEPKESPRMLPMPSPASETIEQATDDGPTEGNANLAANAEVDEPGDNSVVLEEMEMPSQIAARAFAAPADAKALSKKNLWIDGKAGRVYADGYIAMNDGPLEMFACPSGTKEHESIIATLAKASELHAGLLAIGAQPGTPVTYNPSFLPATGQRIRIWVCYFDKDEKYQVADARDWIVKAGTTETLKDDWVFAGSYIWTDPADDHNYYQGDVGDMICVSNFTTAMLDIPVVSSANTDQLEYSPNTPSIPERGTSVRLILEPISLPADGKEKPDARKPPTADVLKKK